MRYILKKIVITVVMIALLINLSSCASLYKKEFVSVNEYVMTENSVADDSVSVCNLSELKSAIRSLVSNDETEGKILFSETYSGEPSEDMADACWQVRTQDALCAYCVDNISYELSKIVSYYEAIVTVSYADKGVPFEEIKKIPFSIGLDEIIKNMIKDGKQKTAILVNSSFLSAADVEDVVSNEYEKDPVISPARPRSSVVLFNGTNSQKLYEVSLYYDLSDEELSRQKTSLNKFHPFDTDMSESTDYEKASAALLFYSDAVYESDKNSVYDALIAKEADSEGLALGYVALCKMLGLDCIVVEGQYNYSNHFWNMVKIDDNYFHIDPSNYILSGYSGQFMNDTDAWGIYKWDTSVYPSCSGIIL